MLSNIYWHITANILVICSKSKTKQNSWYSLFTVLPIIVPSGILSDVIIQCWKTLKPCSHDWLPFLLVFYIQITKSCHLYLKCKLLSTSTAITGHRYSPLLLKHKGSGFCFSSASKSHTELPPWLNVNHN